MGILFAIKEIMDNFVILALMGAAICCLFETIRATGVISGKKTDKKNITLSSGSDNGNDNKAA